MKELKFVHYCQVLWLHFWYLKNQRQSERILRYIEIVSEWMLLNAIWKIFQFSTISWREQYTFDEMITLLDFYTASSLKQQLTYRHVAPLGHIIPISCQILLFVLLNDACLTEKQQLPCFYSLVWPDRDSVPRSPPLQASTMTIIPSMWFWYKVSMIQNKFIKLLKYIQKPEKKHA